ncbi:hypothetical protein FRC18_000785 [Serendipita sp. 400]|nr:hypothetical protein FRC18_000785 [Serendipita sp. 400]
MSTPEPQSPSTAQKSDWNGGYFPVPPAVDPGQGTTEIASGPWPLAGVHVVNATATAIAIAIVDINTCNGCLFRSETLPPGSRYTALRGLDHMIFSNYFI